MGPKADPVATAYERWEEVLEEWNYEYKGFEEEMKSFKKASKSSISHCQERMFESFSIFKESKS